MRCGQLASVWFDRGLLPALHFAPMYWARLGRGGACGSRNELEHQVQAHLAHSKGRRQTKLLSDAILFATSRNPAGSQRHGGRIPRLLAQQGGGHAGGGGLRRPLGCAGGGMRTGQGGACLLLLGAPGGRMPGLLWLSKQPRLAAPALLRPTQVEAFWEQCQAVLRRDAEVRFGGRAVPRLAGCTSAHPTH